MDASSFFKGAWPSGLGVICETVERSLAQRGVSNLLDTRSVPLGGVAVVISMTLNLLALASTVSMLAGGVKARGTVFQNTQGGRPTAV